MPTHDAVCAHSNRTLRRDGQYVPALDGLRGVAITIVLLSHFVSGFFPGGFGVTLFFFISGYLITGLMIDEFDRNGTVAISSFYMRRFLRLAPALIMMVCLTSISCWIAFEKTSTAEIFAAVFYYINYFIILGGAMPLPFAQLWSLAIEEHYYLVFPLVFSLTWKNQRQFLIGLILLCSTILAWRYFLVEHGADETRVHIATDTRIDSILFGAILAVAVKSASNWTTVYGPLWFAGGLALLVSSFVIRNAEFRETLRYSLQGMALIPIVYAVLFSQRFKFARSVLEFAPLVWIGKLSYSLYVWHYAVIPFAAKLIPTTNPVAHAAINILASLLMAILSFYLVERYFLALRNKFRSEQHSPSTEPSYLLLK